MTVTKKDFQRIAATINGATIATQTHLVAKQQLCAELADYFQEENPQFKRGLFLKTCGVL